VSRLLRAFAESYLPAAQAMESEADVELVLGRVSAALESFGRAFIELRRGHEEFGREMGVRPALGEGALQRVRDARQLLAYVLDPRAAGRERELERAFADFMLHQVALLRGVVEGAQALLAQLSPEALAEGVTGSLWPMRAAALWKAFEARFHELADEEDAVSEVLFGREFARAYASMAGQPSAEGDERGPGKGGRSR
jgi:type VI secretion system protein